MTITFLVGEGREGICSKEETLVTLGKVELECRLMFLSNKWGEHWYQKLWEIMRQVLKVSWTMPGTQCNAISS